MAVLILVISVIFYILFAIYCSAWLLPVISILYGKWKLHKKPPPLSPETSLGVSILKPLVGVDPHLYGNLETFFNLEYPTYELLFCVEEEIDPAIMVVHSLIEKYPKVDAKLFIGAKNVGVNPKINNMIQGYEAAQYDLILISDSGLRMNNDTLLDMVGALKDNVGLVHQMPFVCDRKGFAGVLEKVYFGTQFAKFYLLLDLLGINSNTGMSNLFRKNVLEECGGLKSLADLLTEDYELGKKFISKGWKVHISSQPAQQNSGYYSVSNFQARMLRWIRLRGSLLPHLMILDPIGECMLQGVLAAVIINIQFGCSGLAFFFVHCLLWFLLDYILLQVVQNGPIPFSKVDFVKGWLFREMIAFSLHVKSHFEPVIVWRTRKFVVKWGGYGQELKHNSYV